MGNISATTADYFASQSRRQPSEQDGQTLLTSVQKQLIRSSWLSALKHKNEPLEKRVFIRVFKRFPELQALFGLKDVPLAQLKSEPRFLVHIQVTTVYNSIVLIAQQQLTRT